VGTGDGRVVSEGEGVEGGDVTYNVGDGVTGMRVGCAEGMGWGRAVGASDGRLVEGWGVGNNDGGRVVVGGGLGTGVGVNVGSFSPRQVARHWPSSRSSGEVGDGVVGIGDGRGLTLGSRDGKGVGIGVMSREIGFETAEKPEAQVIEM